jgi:type IX secretion system PorP/SprF family membrane protein
MKKICVVIVSFILSITLYAQQKPIPTQYIFDKYYINPAYVGTTNFVTASVNAKQYMNGVDGAPSTQYLAIQYPLLSNFMGLGLKVMNDQIGVSTQNNILLTYAYQIGLAGGTLSFALDGGFYKTKTLYSELIRADDETDPAIPSNNETSVTPDASFGMYYKFEKLYLGYSVYNLIGGKTTYSSTNYTSTDLLSKYHLIMAGYNWKINKDLSFDPLVLCKAAQASPIQVDVVFSAKYKRLLNAALLYSTGRGASAMFTVGLKEGQYKLGYSYDFAIPNNKATFLNSGHEVMFIYSLELTPPASQKDFNPVFYVN